MARRPDASTVQHRHAEGADGGVLEKILAGRLLVLAPHMDDETLGCGGTILLHGHRPDIQCLFATDGAGSPAPLLPWQGRPEAGLAARRIKEAIAAAGVLGIPPENLHFLDLPDGRLASRRPALREALARVIARLQPDYVFAPFRFDVHPDHVALNRAIRSVLCRVRSPPVLLEYFIYHRLRLVPGGDVRRVLQPKQLIRVDTATVAVEKRAALDCYVSQTQVGYPWQDRPILTENSLRQRCVDPEYFLLTDPHSPLSDGIAADTNRIRLATLAMRFGKRPKDRAVAFIRWATGR